MFLGEHHKLVLEESLVHTTLKSIMTVFENGGSHVF